jgi:hypothetical protein
MYLLKKNAKFIHKIKNNNNNKIIDFK